MGLLDVYEVVDVGELYGQEQLNVYFYEQRAALVPIGGNTAQFLASAWADQILPVVRSCQGDDFLHTEVRVRNLFNASDAGSVVTAVRGNGGNGTSETMPGFNAAGLQLKTDNPAVRPGAKRIGGLSENAAADGVFSGPVLTALNNLADALPVPITGGVIIADDVFFPVVVKRVRSGEAGGYTYRLPESQGATVLGTIVEVLINLVVTSQVSRKIGKGA